MKDDFQILFDWHETLLPIQTLVYRTALSGDHIIKIDENLDKPLPYPAFSFALALSSYPFFEHASSAKILFQWRELLRLAREVRLAPYQLAAKKIHRILGPILLQLQQEEIGVEIKPLTHLPGAVMIRLWAQSCHL